MTRRALGIVRVSEKGDRDDSNFRSPDVQTTAITATCKSRDLRLLEVIEEIDVSGGTPLAQRKGLRRAVEAIEAGQADAIVVAYFDRLVRDVGVQSEVRRRVEAAGGDVITDLGDLTNCGANGTFINNIFGSAAQHYKDLIAEKSAAGVDRAIIDKGHWPVVLIPGLRRTEHAIELEPATASAVGEAFRLRARGATVNAVRDHLRAHGIERSFHGTMSLLRSRQAIGEVSYREHSTTIPALIDRDTWSKVQKLKIPRGPKPKSDRLLARLGVLRCASCDGRMVVSTANSSGSVIYRCSSVGDCTRRMAISADIVEGEVIAWVKHHLAGITGTASGASGVAEAQVELDRAQAALESASRTMLGAGLEDEPTVIERLGELREARDEAKEHHAELVDAEQSLSVAVTVGDWDDLTLDERRDLIKAVIERVRVHPGRGAGRIEIEAR